MWTRKVSSRTPLNVKSVTDDTQISGLNNVLAALLQPPDIF